MTMRAVLTTTLCIAISACTGHDVSVGGHDFHLTSALVEEWINSGYDEPVYRITIANIADPCAPFTSNDLPVPVDELWFQLWTNGPAHLEAPQPLEFAGVEICIGAELPCLPSRDDVFHTSGGEVIEAGEDRITLSLDFTHEIPNPGFMVPLDEPFHIDLDLPYTTCD